MSREFHQDQILITRVLRQVAAQSPRRRAFPEARYFWMTAQLIPNQAVQNRALQPMGLLQGVAYGVVAICWAVVLTWKWSLIKMWLSAPDWGSRLLDVVSGSSSVSFSFLTLFGGLLCVTSVLIMHSVFAEE